MDDSRYLTEVYGGCMGPAVPDGTRFVVDPKKEIRPGDLCTVVLRKGKGPLDKFMREAWAGVYHDAAYPNVMGKIYLNRVKLGDREAVLLGQIYPPTVGLVALDEIEALHRDVGCASQAIDLCARGEDRAAFDLLRPFAGKATAPINPDWRPPISLKADAA
jgi:hypothetical protein